MPKSRPSNEPWERAWHAASHYHGFLRLLGARYRGLLASDGSEEAEDLVQAFIVERLPRAVDRLAALPTDVLREKYLAVAFRNFVRDHRRAAHRYRKILEAFAEEPPVGHANPAPLPGLPTGAESLSPALRDVLEGRGDLSSIRKVAQQLGTSRHSARKALLDHLLSLAVRLGKHGCLDERELSVCEQILVHGQSVSETADLIGITETQVRNALASARATIASYIND